MAKAKAKKVKKAKRKVERQPLKVYLRERLKHIPTTVMWGLFAAYCIFSMIYFPVIGRWRDGLISFAYLCICALFYLLEWSLNVRSPIIYTAFVIIFVLFNHLGACFNFYYYITYLDDILHAAWGIVFSTVGIMLIKALAGPAKTKKAVIAYVLFGLGFAMIMSVLWELWEFCGDSILPDMDMQQDTIVDHIESFVMYPDPSDPSPDNLHTWKVYGIAKTVLYDAEGNVIGTIYGGYLDTGLLDTMYDLIFCTASSVIFGIILAADWCTKKCVYRLCIPALNIEVAEWKAEKEARLQGGENAADADESEQPEKQSQADESEQFEEQSQEEGEDK